MTITVLPEFSPRDVNIAWNGINFVGYAEDFLNIVPSADLTSAVVGADGTTAITISPDRTGSVEITLQQNSPTNLELSELLRVQTSSGVLYRGDLTVADKSGSLQAVIKNAHIMKRPEMALGIESGTRVWTFFSEEIEYKATDVLAAGVVGAIRGAAEAVGENLRDQAIEALEEALTNTRGT